MLKFKIQIIDAEYNLGWAIIKADNMTEYGKKLNQLEKIGFIIGRSKKLKRK